MKLLDIATAGQDEVAKPPVLLAVRGMTKQFPGTLALDRVDFEVRSGEIHALCGENGAGKSTLIKILAGIYSADEGEILLHGDPYRPSGRRIAFIHQDLGLVAPYTVAENIALVAGYPRRAGLISWGRCHERAAALLESMGSDIRPDDQVAALTSAQRSIVAIARALAVDADVLILDEPTASLPETDVRRLFQILGRLAQRGMGIVLVTHRLDEVFRVADRVTVLRDGRRISTSPTASTSPASLVFDIVGREMQEMFIDPVPPSKQVLIRLLGWRVGSVGPVDLDLHHGEILGLVGLRGAGQDLIGRSLFGESGDLPRSGAIELDGKVVTIRGPIDAMRHGFGFVSSKRVEEGIAGSMTVRENVFPRPVDPWIIWPQRERRRIRQVMNRFDVRPRDPERAVATLSGGNQQKTVLARWLQTSSHLLILEEPTFGVDVGAKAEIYKILEEYVRIGGGVLLVSSDFEEVTGIAHRALIFRRGRVVGELPRAELSVASLTRIAAGADSVSTGAVG